MPQLWELGTQLRFPALGQWIEITAAVGSHGLEIQYLRKLEAEIILRTSTLPVSRNVLIFERKF